MRAMARRGIASRRAASRAALRALQNAFRTAVLSTSKRVVRALLSLVFPPACEFCGESLAWDSGRSELCDGCRDGLLAAPSAARGCGAIPVRATCPRCALPWRRTSGDRCHYCQRHGYRFDATLALGAYEGRLRRAVIRMKRHAEYPLTAAVGRMLGQRLRVDWADELPDVVVPLPKHWWKRLRRGTNSAELLAESVGRELGRPIVRGGLRCRRMTRKQSLLTMEERRRNAAGSLALAGRREWAGRDVLLVDDIMTTGATASEAARVLKQAGARRVRVAVVARALPGAPSSRPPPTLTKVPSLGPRHDTVELW